MLSEAIYASASDGYDALFARATNLFIPILLQAARIAPGHQILDVATGTGAVARAAANIVGPEGSIVGGDISPSMLEEARRNLKGLPVTLKELDGQALPFPDRSFDAVTCQLGLMFFTDPTRGLSEFRRVLRDGGYAAASVTSTPERSLFARIGAVIARHVPEKAPKLNRFFSIPTVDRMRDHFRGAGFHDVDVRSESRPIGFESFAAYFSGTEKGAGLSGQEFVQLPAELRQRVRDEVRAGLGVTDNQRVVIDMEVLIGSGRRV